MISLVPVPMHPDRVMIRDDARNTCLYSNRDGRFGWYACTPRFDDQHWMWVVSQGGRGKMVRAVNSGRCLTSNRDGRLGAWECTAEHGDHDWALQPKVGGTLAGEWEWSDGARTFMREDGTFVMPNDRSGTWRLSERGGFEVLWGDGRVDRVHVSADGSELRGHSFLRGAPGGQPVSARRHARHEGSPPPRRELRDCGTGPDDAGCQEERNGQHAMGRDDWLGLFASLQATSSEISKRNMLATAAGSSYFTAQQLMQALDLFRSELTQLEVVRAMAPHVIDPSRALGYGQRMRSSLNRERLVKLLSEAPAKRCPPQPACGIACPDGNFAHDKNGCALCACAPERPGTFPGR